MTTHNSISIDEAKFLKTSKKLLQHLTDEYSLNIKLSQIQEALSQSLGYRNLHSLQQVFVGNVDNHSLSLIDSIPKPDIFDKIELDQAIQIIYNLMDVKSGGDMWRGRAISLISIIMKTLMYMQKEKEIILDSDIVREYLILDNIIKLYKTRRDFPNDIKQGLKSYLTSLPGFQEGAPIQNETVREQHGYLQMQFFPVLNMLKKIEENNFIIADKKWFYLEKISRVVSASAGYGSSNHVEKETSDVLSIVPALKHLDFLDDSWLGMPEYESLVSSLFKKNSLEELRVSDLLVYATTIISPAKRSSLYLVLNSILDNYSIASSISQKISQHFK